MCGAASFLKAAGSFPEAATGGYGLWGAKRGSEKSTPRFCPTPCGYELAAMTTSSLMLVSFKRD